MFHSASGTVANRTFERLVAGLEIEFGQAAAQGLAQQFIEAEDADFAWEARHAQRWLGCYESLDDGEALLDRMAVLGRMGDRFYVAILIVDDGDRVQAMLGKRDFAMQAEALEAYATTR